MLNSKKVLIFVEATYEDLELWYPKLRLREEGVQVLAAGPEACTFWEFCDNCGARLQRFRCRLICPQCGFSQSVSES